MSRQGRQSQAEASPKRKARPEGFQRTPQRPPLHQQPTFAEAAPKIGKLPDGHILLVSLTSPKPCHK